MQALYDSATQTLETPHKSALKPVAHKTNNQASVGGSVTASCWPTSSWRQTRT